MPISSAHAHGSDSAAELLLRAVKAQGIDYMFVNPGTDFAPIVEAMAACKSKGSDIPTMMVIPHENCAVSMAHGYYMVTGKPQAVMVHTNVGTANALNSLMDASRENVPILLLAGRNPVTEQGMAGARDGMVHWAQEMFDQAGMLREVVKWDYEMRFPDQSAGLVARALEVMMAAPRGSAYLTLPREVLGAMVPASNQPLVPHAYPSTPSPDPAAINALADMVGEAKRPLIITATAGRTAAGMDALGRVAERFAIPVVSFNARYLCLPFSHPMNLGYQVKPLLNEADLVIVLDHDVPWYPSQDTPQTDCRVVQVGDDPAFVRYPTRGFRSDLSITSGTVPFLDAIEVALAARGVDKSGITVARREELAGRWKAMRAQWLAATDAAAKRPTIKTEYLNRCIAEAIGPEAMIVNEYWARQWFCPREQSGTWFGSSPAGGLGWAMGAALGAKLAAPDRLVVSTVGDGTYVFSNPAACHWVGAALKLPTLTIINNNHGYNAIRLATLAMYPNGAARAENDAHTLAGLEPTPAYEKFVEASGGYGERVETPDALPQALARAVRMVQEEKRQAVLNVICPI